MVADLRRCYRRLDRDRPPQVRKAFFKQATFLERNLQHPSLRAKNTMPTDLWQARVNQNWRFYFHIVGDIYLIRDIIPHPKK